MIRRINSNENMRRQRRLQKLSWITAKLRLSTREAFQTLPEAHKRCIKGTAVNTQLCYLIVDMIILSLLEDKYEFLSSPHGTRLSSGNVCAKGMRMPFCSLCKQVSSSKFSERIFRVFPSLQPFTFKEIRTWNARAKNFRALMPKHDGALTLNWETTSDQGLQMMKLFGFGVEQSNN